MSDDAEPAEEITPHLNGSIASSPQVSFRDPDVEVPYDDEDVQDVTYENEADLEERLRSHNEEDVEAELEKLIIDEDAESATRPHETDTELNGK